MAEGSASDSKPKVWPVERYARYVSTTGSNAAGSMVAKKTDGGKWQHYSSKEVAIQLALIDLSHIMITSGTMIFESFSLWEAQKWLKIVTKGDSAMFIYRLKDENRRFRIKFSSMSSLTSPLDTCRQFVSVLAPLVPVREMSDVFSTRGKDITTRGGDKDASTRSVAMESDSQFDEESQMLSLSQTVGSGYEPHRKAQSHNIPSSHSQEITQKGSGLATSTLQPDESKLIPVPDIAKLLQTEGKTLGRAYVDTNFPTEQLGRFIRLCLTDSNFPGFVESVEKELNSMTS